MKMSLHTCSVFRNSCIKSPLNPKTRRRPTSGIGRTKSASSHSGEIGEQIKSNTMTSTSVDDNNKNSSDIKDCDGFLSFIDFFESIPDYNEVNHLSEREFQIHLESLRRKQQELRDFCFSGSSYEKKSIRNDDESSGKYSKNYNNYCLAEEKSKFREINSKTPVRFSDKDFYDDDSIDEIKSKFLGKCKSRKGSAKSGGSISTKSGTALVNLSDEEDDGDPTPLHHHPRYVTVPRSKSVSPCRHLSQTIYHREEEKRILDDLYAQSKCLFSPKGSTKSKNESQFKANPVPLTSRIPLYKHIVAEQEHKNELAKLSSSIELQAQMKPFSFTENRKSRPNSRCLVRSNSTPNLTVPLIKPAKFKSFRAKPCPKNLFSNYFYHKLSEDEYFRNLNRKIRAEELLRASSLPPSMAKREKPNKSKSREHCPRSETSCSGNSSKKSKRKKRIRKRNASTHECNAPRRRKSSTKLQNDFITTSVEPFEFQTEKRYQDRASKTKAPSTTTSSTSGSVAYSSPMMHIYPASRPNLAATLRAQISRKKLHSNRDEEMVPPLPTKGKTIDWGVRRSPAWKSIYFDGTNEDDISMRLATRRAEQRLRQEQHSLHMDLMHQRVRAAPLLLEGPTLVSRPGKMSHDCGQEAKDRQARKWKKFRGSGNRQNATSKQSHYSDSKNSCKSFDSSKKCHHHRLDDLDDLDSYVAGIL